MKLLALLFALAGYLYMGALVSLFPLIPISLGVAMEKWKNPQYPALNPYVIGIWLLLSVALFVGLVRFMSPGRDEGEHPLSMLLTPEQSQPLMLAIHRIPHAIWPRRVHHIVVHDQCDAWIVRGRILRRNLQGNCLMLGLPLLYVLSPEQFLAILGRALWLATLSHDLLSRWIRRTQERWTFLVEASREVPHWSAFLDRPFAWYVPLFARVSSILARASEYEADRRAGQAAGARCLADAMIALHAAENFLRHNFWPALHKRAEEDPSPPDWPYTEMQGALAVGGFDDTGAWTEEAMQAQSAGGVRPSLGDRLTALGQDMRRPSPPVETAGAHFWRRGLPEIIARFNECWRDDVAAYRREQEQTQRALRERLLELDARAKGGSLTIQEQWEVARGMEDLQGADAALPMYRGLLERTPDDAQAHFALGRILLAKGHAEGIHSLEKAMELEGDAIIPGCELVEGFLRRSGRAAEASAYARRASERASLLESAERERFVVGPSEPLLPHELPAELVEAIRERLRPYRRIRRAYLVRKPVKYLPEKPAFVLAVTVAWYLPCSDSWVEALAVHVSEGARFPYHLTGLLVDGFVGRLHVGRIPGALIYRRKGR